MWPEVKQDKNNSLASRESQTSVVCGCSEFAASFCSRGRKINKRVDVETSNDTDHQINVKPGI